MLCSPIASPRQPAGGATASPAVRATAVTTSSSGAGGPVASGKQTRAVAGYLSALSGAAKVGRHSSSTTSIGPPKGAINNNSVRQQNFETTASSNMTHTSESARKTCELGAADGATATATTTIREIKSRNLGPHSPLCQSIGANLGEHSPASTANSNSTSGSANLMVERRQAFSMERLNNINASPTMRYLSRIQARNGPSGTFVSCKENNNGSLSSGSNSSIDESASDGEQPDQFHLLNVQHKHHLIGPQAHLSERPAGLSRSASRVSRFRSAKEFFERLSSVNSNHNGLHLSPQQQNADQPHFKPIKRSPERQASQLQQAAQLPSRGKLASRLFEPLAHSRQANSRSSSSGLHSSSPTINLQPICKAQPSKLERQSPSKLASGADQGDAAATQSRPVAALAPSGDITRFECPAATLTRPPVACSGPTLAAKPPPRSLQVQSGCSPESPARDLRPATQTQQQTPIPPKSLTLPISFNSSSSAYVKLKTTDHSGLSTNTILHINNSHRNSDNKSVINCHQELAALAFRGDNVIVGNGSLLVRRNKQLRIKFDEATAATFEYPSEEAMLRDERDSVAETETDPEATADSGAAETPAALVQTGASLLSSQRLMWRQSFGLNLSNRSLSLVDSSSIGPPVALKPDGGVGGDGDAAAADSAQVELTEPKDDKWKGEW